MVDRRSVLGGALAGFGLPLPLPAQPGRSVLVDDGSGRPTAVSILARAIADATGWFGPRDPRWTVLGVQLHTGPQPQLRFFGQDMVAVQITRDCQSDEERAVFQIGHEALHLFGPTGSPASTVIEEALAVYQAYRTLSGHYGGSIAQWRDRYGEPGSAYQRAYGLFERVYDRAPSAEAVFAGLRRLRQMVSPSISRASAADLRRHLPWIDADHAAALAAPFG